MPLLSDMSFDEYSRSLLAYCAYAPPRCYSYKFDSAPTVAHFTKGNSMHIKNVIIAKTDYDLTRAHLDAMQDAFTTLDYQPAIVAGKDKGPGQPSHGTVTALRRTGDELLATIETSHETIADALRRGAKLSTAIYHGLKRNGKNYLRALRLIVLPDVKAPQLPALVPSGVQAFDSSDYERIVSYGLNDASASKDPRVRRGEAAARIHDLIDAWLESHSGKDYTDGLVAILRLHPDLAAAYRGIREDGDWQPSQWEKDRA
jgi:hypothetical protein